MSIVYNDDVINTFVRTVIKFFESKNFYQKNFSNAFIRAKKLNKSLEEM